MTILERFAASYGRFNPSKSDEYFALQLARKLDSPSSAAYFATLVNQRDRYALLRTYFRAKKQAGKSNTLLSRFRQALDEDSREPVVHPSALLSIKIERRAISAVIFFGTNLDFFQSRQLSSKRDVAENSVISFLNWTLESNSVDSATVEGEEHSENRRAELHALVVGTLRNEGIAIHELSWRELLPAYGVPPLNNRRQIRQAVATIWPMLDQERPGQLDAAAIGFYIQTERLFHH